ncbi:MAG: metal-dependent hydrolase [Pseudomonadales bacterium]|jgi:predicted metal-dependent hydrolase
MAEPISYPPIQVRDLDLRPDESTPRYWFGGDPFTTHFFNAISTTFPDGERFFIRSVRHYSDAIADPTLVAEVAAFAGQEARHSREHDSHVTLLIDQGYPGLRIFNRNLRTVTGWLNAHAPRASLALTTAIEHVTAVVAHQILEQPDTWTGRMDPSMQRLWRWHAVEETEHKAVAYDVYQLAVGSVWMRRLAMADATVGFLAEVFFRHAYLLIKDRQMRPSVLMRGFGVLFGRGGFIRVLWTPLMEFWRRDFHPWQIDNTALLAQRKLEWGFAAASRSET